MQRSRLAVLLLVAGFAQSASTARAGGWEFPADGTRGLGRGGARAARADDPSIMTRNPAALALLWDDQAYLGAHLLLVDACMQPTGAYAWGVRADDVIDLGEGPLFMQAQPGDTDLEGEPLTGYAHDPYPEICHEGAAPFLPNVALSMKLDEDLGIGIGFFPPDSASLYQWGNRDGTVDTPNGLRPNPLRYYRSHQNVTFFSLLGAAGYRVAPWISLGAGFQWSLAAYSATTWSTPISGLNPSSDVRGDVFGRDLFIPGIVASVHLQPLDFLDVVLGVRWYDRTKSKVKLDITTGAFGTGEVFEYVDADTGEVTQVGSSIPTTAHNQPGELDSPPAWAPQLTFALRFSDLLRPRVDDLGLAHEAAAGKVEDHMATERWDLEVDVIYYLSSVYDQAQFTTRDARLELLTIDPNSVVARIPASPGDCLEEDPQTLVCVGDRRVKTDYGGRDQLTLRFGGEYNVFPGVLALRAGVSYETRAQDPEMLNVLSYMLSRTGLHGGLTLRVAGKTDVSFGFAHFIHENVRLQVNDSRAVSRYPPRYKSEEYNFAPGEGVEDFEGNGADAGGFDGVAGVEIPNGDRNEPLGPFFVNAGSFFYHLDVVSLSFTQHF